MITLFGFGAGFGLPEISPFVTKTEVQLKMAGVAYRKEKAMPPASPKGQLPYIVDEADRVADSTFIRAHIEGKYASISTRRSVCRRGRRPGPSSE
jgi:glutathione S-transferase